MRARDRAEPHERVHDGQVIALDKSLHFLGRACRNDAATNDDDGALRLGDLAHGLSNADEEIGVGLAGRLDGRLFRLVFRLREKEVARHVDEHGAGTAMLRDGERLAHGRHELLRALDLEVVLRDRHRDVEDVRLLERIAAERGRVDLPRDRDDRDGIHERRCESRDEVRRARTARRDADADLARRTRVAIGSMRRVLLVRHENLADVFRVIERVVERQDHAARITEDGVDLLLAQAREHGFCAFHHHQRSPQFRHARR